MSTHSKNDKETIKFKNYATKYKIHKHVSNNKIPHVGKF